MNGAFLEMESLHIPAEVITSMKNGIDCNVYFFGNLVSVPVMYLVLIVSIVILVGTYIAINALKKKDK